MSAPHPYVLLIPANWPNLGENERIAIYNKITKEADKEILMQQRINKELDKEIGKQETEQLKLKLKIAEINLGILFFFLICDYVCLSDLFLCQKVFNSIYGEFRSEK